MEDQKCYLRILGGCMPPFHTLMLVMIFYDMDYLNIKSPLYVVMIGTIECFLLFSYLYWDDKQWFIDNKHHLWTATAFINLIGFVLNLLIILDLNITYFIQINSNAFSALLFICFLPLYLSVLIMLFVKWVALTH